LMNNPDQIDRYRQEWSTWWDGLGASVHTMDAWDARVPLPPPGGSIFSHGWLTCTQFALAPTLKAFLEGVTRALVYTPLFSLVAMLLFLNDVYLCYAALYTIVMIIVFVLGLLGLLGLSLGPVESLSFAIVIGVSVDYLVHFAYAFKHSLMAEQYYKSRAVLMARFGSTVASGLTTLCAVLPLLAANIVPLRIFGVIFTIVALVSLLCATLLFNALLMVTGPGIRMSVHSLPSGSSLPPVAFSRTLAPTNEDGARAQPPLSPREHCRPGVLVAFGGKQPSANGTNRSEATTVSTSTASDRGVFRGHMANGVIGAIKV